MIEVIIVGGSVGGLACAHALLKSGNFRITVLERASSIKAAGAGLGLAEDALDILGSFGLAQELDKVSMPMPIEINRAVGPHRVRELQRDNHYNRRSLHWSDLHRMLLSALPQDLIKFGTTVKNSEQVPGSDRVRVQADRKEPSGADGADVEQIELECDLLVAADGSMSDTRKRLRPNEARRYSGYCAWRGVVADDEAPEATRSARHGYPELGRALYFDLAEGSHAVLYELPGKRLNWLWYVNQPEPTIKGHSVTVKADEEKIKHMRSEARKTFTPELATLMEATSAPFINAIYDREPLKQWVYGRIVLVGEAAHPTTPHALRSTNMAILDAVDAGCLRECLSGVSSPADASLAAALAKFQEQRIERTAREVLFSRHLGRIKQCLDNSQDWFAAEEPTSKGLGQANMDSFLVTV